MMFPPFWWVANILQGGEIAVKLLVVRKKRNVKAEEKMGPRLADELQIGLSEDGSKMLYQKMGPRCGR
jgi:hypothetical protein